MVFRVPHVVLRHENVELHFIGAAHLFAIGGRWKDAVQTLGGGVRGMRQLLLGTLPGAVDERATGTDYPLQG